MTRRLGPVVAIAAAAPAVHAIAVLAGKPFALTQLTMTAYYTVVAAGLSLLMGYAGQISLGHAAFFAIGGYGAAALGAGPAPLHPWAALACAVALAAAVALVLGVPVLKLRGHYLAMATLGFGIIVQSLAIGTARLGGADGIADVAPLPLAPGLAVGGGSGARVANYYVAWGLVALVVLLLSNLVDSRVGRALRAIHGSEDAARAMGVDVARYKLGTFVLSAALAALAGAFLTHYNGGIGPSEASIMKSVRYVAVVAVGGMGSLAGTVATSAVLTFLSLRGYFGTLDDAVFGAVLIGVMLFAPDGVLRAGLLGRLRRGGAGEGA
jgi:branched-chain amino acid transport system permease protein